MNIVINVTADDVIAWMHERMIANVCTAERRRLRRDLTDTEREQYLRGADRRFDLIVAADVLPYVGALDQIMVRAAAVLRRGGALIFSVDERPDGGDDYARTVDGRYQHTARYVGRILTAADLHPELVRAFVRLDGGTRVVGLIGRATRTHDAAAVARWGVGASLGVEWAKFPSGGFGE